MPACFVRSGIFYVFVKFINLSFYLFKNTVIILLPDGEHCI